MNPSPDPIPETTPEQEELICKFANQAMHYPDTTDTPVTTDPAWIHGCMQELWQAAYSAGRTADERDTRDLQDALMLLRIFLTRKDMATVECHKKKVADWMQRKGRQGSILRAAIRKGDGEVDEEGR